MPDNRGVAYMGPGEVEVQTIDFPSFTVQDGPGVPEENVGRECHHGVILRIVSTNICGSDQHMVRGRTTAPEGVDPRARDHRRGGREGPRRRVPRRGRPRVRAVQHRLRALSQLQAAGHRHLPHREPRAARRGVRLRRHGRLGRRPGRVRDGPVRGLQLPQVPRQGAGDGEDPRPDDAVGHLPDRLPRLRDRGRAAREHRLRRRRGPGRPRGRRTPPSCSARRS